MNYAWVGFHRPGLHGQHDQGMQLNALKSCPYLTSLQDSNEVKGLAQCRVGVEGSNDEWNLRNRRVQYTCDHLATQPVFPVPLSLTYSVVDVPPSVRR